MPHKKSDGARSGPGELIIIGGYEDKNYGHAREILEQVAARASGGALLVATLAGSEAMEMWATYRKTFHGLGVKKLEHLNLEKREESGEDARIELVHSAGLVFFTGGDQLRITSSFGGSALCNLLRERYSKGLPIAGTSAGASAMSETMLVEGSSDEAHQAGDTLRMAPGLGLTRDLVIDQHFARRGRLSRLLGAIAQNPRLLGVGIDENTAILAREGRSFEVIGEGAVYVINGQTITYTNLSESNTALAISAHNVKLDVLSRGDRFDLKKRVAVPR